MKAYSATVLTGSFNFTKAADQKNAGNLLVIRDDKVAAKYEANSQAHFRHSEYYAGVSEPLIQRYEHHGFTGWVVSATPAEQTIHALFFRSSERTAKSFTGRASLP